MSEITIVTNTIRRPIELVEKSVRASLSQNSEIDVVLVDQNPVPLLFPKDVSDNPRFHHQHVNVPAVSMARNRALLPGDCKWIIFCDDDGYMNSRYLSAFHARIRSNPEISIFAGVIRRIDTGEFYSRRQAFGGNMKWFWNTKLLMGSNLCVKREVFERLGKFDEDFGAGARYGSSEETDFAWNAFFNRESVVFAPELVVFHVPPFTGEPGGELQKAWRYGVGKGALVRKWLGRGHFWPAFELLEMLLLPLLQMTILILRFRIPDARLRFAGFRGRLRGLLGPSA
jgi:GT2 family glycosyltransferase